MKKKIGLMIMFLVMFLLGGVAMAGGGPNDGVGCLCHQTGVSASLDVVAGDSHGGAVIVALHTEPGEKGIGDYGLSFKDDEKGSDIYKTSPADYLPDIGFNVLC